MSKEELQELIAPLSEADKQLLREMLMPRDYEAAFEAMQATNPLKGSVSKYDDPFGAACDSDDWEVLRDSD